MASLTVYTEVRASLRISTVRVRWELPLENIRGIDMIILTGARPRNHRLSHTFGALCWHIPYVLYPASPLRVQARPVRSVCSIHSHKQGRLHKHRRRWRPAGAGRNKPGSSKWQAAGKPRRSTAQAENRRWDLSPSRRHSAWLEATGQLNLILIGQPSGVPPPPIPAKGSLGGLGLAPE